MKFHVMNQSEAELSEPLYTIYSPLTHAILANYANKKASFKVIKIDDDKSIVRIDPDYINGEPEIDILNHFGLHMTTTIADYINNYLYSDYQLSDWLSSLLKFHAKDIISTKSFEESFSEDYADEFLYQKFVDITAEIRIAK